MCSGNAQEHLGNEADLSQTLNNKIPSCECKSKQKPNKIYFFTTHTLTLALTSECNLIGTVYIPSALIGSSS